MPRPNAGALQGKRILVTRTREQASELAALLEAAGAETLLVPTIEIAPPVSYCAVDAVGARSGTVGTPPSPRRVAVIGAVTAQAAERAGLSVALIPKDAVAESLAEALAPHCGGASMLLVRAEQGRATLPEALAEAGAQVTLAAAYRNVLPTGSVAALRVAFSGEGGMPDAVTFTSSSTATNLFQLLDAAGLVLPEGMALASIGPVTSRTLQELGHVPTMEAEEATVAALAAALVKHFTRHQA